MSGNEVPRCLFCNEALEWGRSEGKPMLTFSVSFLTSHPIF
jgi:hypothetical protein